MGLLVLAGVLAWQVTLISEPPYAAVGPRAFAWIAVAMLGACGAALTFQGVTGGWPRADDEAGAPDLRGALWMGLGLVLNTAFIDGIEFVEGALYNVPRLGFILSSTLMFVCIARALDSRSPVRDGLVGFVLAVLVFGGFGAGLGIWIGEGPVERYVRPSAEAIRDAIVTAALSAGGLWRAFRGT